MGDYKEYKDQSGNTTVIIQHKSNGLGTAGFVLALLGFLLSWIPVFGWVMWAFGFLFSFLGLFKAPRGLAIAGIIISFIGFFFVLFLATTLMALLAL